MKLPAAVALAAILALPLSVEAQAGRHPNPQERAELEQVLRDLGVTSWDEIELKDHGRVWKVDDAIGPDGREYDLRLRFGTYEPVSAKLD